MRLHLLLRNCRHVGLAIVGATLLTIGAGNVASGAPVSLPFSDTFSVTSPTDFAFTSTNASVTHTINDSSSGVLRITGTAPAGGQAMNGLVEAPTALGQPIVMKADITPTAWGTITGGHAAGFLAFSNNAAAGAFNSTGYLADITFPVSSGAAANGSIRIFDASVGFGAPIAQAVFSTAGLALNETYQLTFTATPNASLLDLELTIVDTTGTLIDIASNPDPAGTVSLSVTTTLPASTGTYFGLRQRVGNSGTTRSFTAEYDNFSIVPEPNSFVLIGIGSVAFGLIRWRKRS